MIKLNILSQDLMAVNIFNPCHVMTVMAAGVWLILSQGACNPYAVEPLRTERTSRNNHVQFPIKQAVHEDISCDGCHGPFDTFTDFTCISCHNHNDIDTIARHDGITGFTYTDTSCLECHPDGEAIGLSRADHVFPIASGAHRNMPCAECHTLSYPEFTCIDCHTHNQLVVDTIHGSISNYVYSSSKCFNCHPDGIGGMTRTEHNRLFRISSGRHRNIACSDCHPNGRDTFECFDCHSHTCQAMTREHQGEVRNFRCDSNLCASSGCHPNGISRD